MSKVKDIKPGWYEIVASNQTWFLNDKGKKYANGTVRTFVLVYGVKDSIYQEKLSKEVKIYLWNYRDKKWGRLVIDTFSFDKYRPMFHNVTNKQKHFILKTFFEGKGIPKTMKVMLSKI